VTELTHGWTRCPVAAVILVLGTGCGQFTAPHFCLDLDSSCSTGGYGGGGSAIRYYVVGFPANKFDRNTIAPGGGYRGTMHIGDTLSLRLTMTVTESVGSGIPVPVDRWEVTDTSVAQIVTKSDGAGTITALRPGTLSPVAANTTWYSDVYSCDAQGECTRISEIVVAP
jgi:hypothetical protein